MKITWNTFTKAISEAELESGTQAQILIKLFKRAGCISRKEDSLSESAAKKWINGTRNCNVSTYFPDKEFVDIQKIYNFFRNRPADRLEKLQQNFREERDDRNAIDYETKDMDRLCWSLVNQFLDLLQFEREDISNIHSRVDDSFISGQQDVAKKVISAKQEKKSISQNIEQPERMLDIFNRSFQDFGIQDFLETNPVESIKSFRIEDVGYFIGRIKTNQERSSKELLDKDGETYEKISSFSAVLLEYIMYLKNHMREEAQDNQWKYYISDISSESEFKSKTDDFRQQLKSLYEEISLEAEKSVNE